jgi:peptidoglycan/LPS O-acetylase OafA/YrhL
VILIALTTALTHHLDLLPHKFLLHQLLFLQAYSHSEGSTFVDVLRHPVWYLTHLPSMRLYAHHLPVGLQGLWPTLPSCSSPFWSLSIEEYFYLLWAPIVLRCSRRWIVSIGIAVCIAEMLLRWMAPDAVSYFNIFYRFDTLLFGAFLALLFEHWHRSSVPPRISVIFKSVIVLCALIIGAILYAIRPILGMEIRFSPLVLVAGITAFGVAAACLIGLLVLHSGSNWWLARLLRTAPLTYIGTISYTMYLVHIYAGWLVLQLAKRVHVLMHHVVLQNAVAVIVTIMLARASWHFLEKPLLRWKDRRFPSAPHPPEPALT